MSESSVVNEEGSTSSEDCESNNSSGSVKTPPLECIQHLLELSMKNPTLELFKFIRDELGGEYYEYFMEEAALSHLMKFAKLEKDVSKWSFADIPIDTLEDWVHGFYLPNDEFWKTFHISKATLKFILIKAPVNVLQFDEFPDSDSFEEYVLKIILLSIWYLRNDDASLNDCANVFHIPLEIVEDLLAKGFALIIEIGSHIPAPTYVDFMVTEQYFKKNHQFPIVGALGFQGFKADDGQEIMAQFICNHKCEFIAVDTCFHTRICVGLTKSRTLQNLIRSVPSGSYLAGFEEYGKYPQNTLKLLTPRDKDGARCTDTYNKALDQVLSMAHLTLIKLISRFPRVCKLHKRMRDAIMAAFTLHNLCSFHNDEAPLL